MANTSNNQKLNILIVDDVSTNLVILSEMINLVIMFMN